MNDDPRLDELRRMGARIGANVFMGADVYIERDFAPLLTIEDGVVLARGVCILLHDSSLNNSAGEPIKFGRVTLRERCYIGANVTILCGVEVGRCAVVGACSLVTSDIPDETIAYGQPARARRALADAVDAQRRSRSAGDRFLYLDAAPWRDAREDTDRQVRIQRLIRGLVEPE